MKIKAQWRIECSCGTHVFDLSDVHCKTEKEWLQLSETEQTERLQKAIYELPETPGMILEIFEIK